MDEVHNIKSFLDLVHFSVGPLNNTLTLLVLTKGLGNKTLDTDISVVLLADQSVWLALIQRACTIRSFASVNPSSNAIRALSN